MISTDHRLSSASVRQAFFQDMIDATFSDPQLTFVERGPGYLLGHAFCPAPDFNLFYGGAFDGDLHAAVARQIDRFRTWQLPFLWIVSPEAAGVSDVLEAQGLLKVSNLPLMTLDLTDLREQDAQLPNFELRQVTTDADLTDWSRVAQDAFDFSPEMLAMCRPVFSGLLRDPRSRVQLYLGLQDGEPVGTSMTVNGDEVVGVWCVGTAKAARRRGVGAAMTTGPLLIARAAGQWQAMLGATAAGFPVYQRLGWETQLELPFYLFMPERVLEHQG